MVVSIGTQPRNVRVMSLSARASGLRCGGSDVWPSAWRTSQRS